MSLKPDHALGKSSFFYILFRGGTQFMLKIFFPIFLISILTQKAFSYTTIERNEVSRFLLMHDRRVVDRQLKSEKYQSFLDLDFLMSSGLKALTGDITDSTNSNYSSTQKLTNIAEVLNKSINVEHALDIDLVVAAPLPYFSYGHWGILSSLFYEKNIEVGLSIFNGGDVTNPQAQTYIRSDTKFGSFVRLKRKEKEEWQVSFYQLKRSDIYATLTALSIASSTKIFNFDDLKTYNTTYNTDISYLKRTKKGEIKLEVQELKLKTTSSKKTNYGSRPLLHARYRLLSSNNILSYQPFVGVHFRKKYSLHEGLYAGISLSPKQVPVLFETLKISASFLTFITQFKSHFFHISYTLKTPFRNPQERIWVPTLHSFQLNIPFP